MEQLKTNKSDLFQDQLKNFNAFLNGSKIAKLSALMLAVFSVVMAYISRSDLSQALPLLIGAFIQIVYAVKYLEIADIRQKSYTQTSLGTSVLKYKLYLSNRKKYDIVVIVLYALTIIPFTLRYQSLIFVISAFIVGILSISIWSVFAFKKLDNNIDFLEATLKSVML